MRKQAKNFVSHPLFSGSAIMVVGSNLNNVFNYTYHLIFGRILGPEHYGELVSMISLLGLLSASFSFFGLVIVKFAAVTEDKELPTLYTWVNDKTTKIGVILGLLVLALSGFLADFLHVDQKIVMLLSLLILVNVKLFTARSFLNGLMKFKQVVIGSNIDILSRIVFGSIFVYLGFSVFGAVLGLLFASLVATTFYFRFLNLKGGDGRKYKFDKQKEVLKYTAPVFFMSVATMSFFSSDVILVKHFLNSHDAGIYGALANMGKIIFYALSPITIVMFPMVSRKHAKGESSKKLFIFAIGLVSCGVLSVLFIYKFFPELAITILFGKKFLEASSLLFKYGTVMAIFSVSSLILNYYLSIEKYIPVIFLFACSTIQVLGITIYHESLHSVVVVSFVSVAFLASSLLIYSVNERKKG